MTLLLFLLVKRRLLKTTLDSISARQMAEVDSNTMEILSITFVPFLCAQQYVYYIFNIRCIHFLI